MVHDNPETFEDLDGHIDCGGKDAGSLGCQTMARWNAQHGIRLCQGILGCTQTTDPNGVTTVQTERAKTNVTQNPGGSSTVTITTVTNTYQFSPAGSMTLAQQQTVVETSTVGTYVTQWRTTPTTVNLTYADAEGQFGRDNLLAFQNSFLDRRGTASRFPGQVATEAKEHPGRDVGRVVEVGFLFVPVAEEVEGIKMSVELHWAFVELLKALEGEE